MAKQSVQPTYTFVNPNTPEAFRQMLKQLLLEKLLSQPTPPDSGTRNGSAGP